MPRLFTALALPHSCVAHLSLLRGGLPGARFIDPENYRLTLRFIGDIENHTADEIVSGLDRIQKSPFALHIDGLDIFGGNTPHALIATVTPSKALNELQCDIERVCQRLHLPADARKFTPHITLARLKNVTPQRAVRFLANHGGFSTSPFQVKDFTLYSARESIGGGPYIREEMFALSHRTETVQGEQIALR